MFARFTRYHRVFRSCNAGSKTNTWCGKCAKCLFTAIILSPFLSDDRLFDIFGKNLFADSGLLPFFDQLTGDADEKPFECIGTIADVNLALCEAIRRRGSVDLPFLLKHYISSASFLRYNSMDFNLELSILSDAYFVMPEFMHFLVDGMQNVTGKSPNTTIIS